MSLDLKKEKEKEEEMDLRMVEGCGPEACTGINDAAICVMLV